MNETRDLGTTLVAAALLLFGVGYLTQCSAAARRTQSESEAAATVLATPRAAVEEERGGRPKSIRELADEEEHEEAEKIRKVAHALQTIGANPEMRATLGLPP